MNIYREVDAIISLIYRLIIAVGHQNSANSPKTFQNGLRRGQTTKNRTRQ